MTHSPQQTPRPTLSNLRTLPSLMTVSSYCRFLTPESLFQPRFVRMKKTRREHSFAHIHSHIFLSAFVAFQPGVHAETLPTTNKGNVQVSALTSIFLPTFITCICASPEPQQMPHTQRKLVEKMFDQELRDTRWNCVSVIPLVHRG